jgi:hypothetical protein
VVIDARKGNVLQAVAPDDVHGGTIAVRDLAQPAAQGVVDAYVTAAAGR